MNPAPDMTKRIADLHDWYCRNVMTMRLTPQVEKLWFDWLRAGYCGPDLRAVILYIRRQIAIGKRNEGALKLSNLIAPGELGYVGFDQDLGLARARANLNPLRKLEQVPGAVAEATRGKGEEEKRGEPQRAPATDEQLRKLREAIE